MIGKNSLCQSQCCSKMSFCPLRLNYFPHIMSAWITWMEPSLLESVPTDYSKHYILHLASSTGLASNKNNYCQMTLKCSFYWIKNKVWVSVVQFTSNDSDLSWFSQDIIQKILLDSQVTSLIQYDKSFTDSFKWPNKHLTYWTLPKFII